MWKEKEENGSKSRVGKKRRRREMRGGGKENSIKFFSLDSPARLFTVKG